MELPDIVVTQPGIEIGTGTDIGTVVTRFEIEIGIVET